MLKLLAPVDFESLPGVRPLPPAAAVAPPPTPRRVKRPPLSWRVRQALNLLRPAVRRPRRTSWRPLAVAGWLLSLAAWVAVLPIATQYTVPILGRLVARLGFTVGFAELRLRVLHGDGTATDYGLASRRLVTDAGVAFVMACFDNTNEPEVLKYHGFGTGTTAEAQTETALVTELTTAYASANTRPTGTQAHGTGTHTGTYTTVGTLTPSADVTVSEHGIFSQAANSGGTLLDRSKFTGVPLVSANPDSLQATYTFTLTSGG